MVKTQGEKGVIEYILDTNVLVHESNVIFKFQEHNITIFPIMLEELDKLKKGNNDPTASIVRELHRKLDMLGEIMIPAPSKPVGKDSKPQVQPQEIEMVCALHSGGVSLGPGLGKIEVKKIDLKLHAKLKKYYSANEADHQILSGVLKLYDEAKGTRRKVVLVSKDINLRQKAKSLGIVVEDYKNDQVPIEVHQKPIKNVISNDLLSGLINLLNTHGQAPIDGAEYSSVIDKTALTPNMGVILQGKAKKKCLARVNADITKFIKAEVKTVSSITPRNAEQIFVVDAILNSGASLFLFEGIAGTGKTLLAMASAIHLVEGKKFHQIVMSAPMVTVGDKDRGALPGDTIEKTKPYMLGLHQNLNFIKSSLNAESLNSKEPATNNDAKPSANKKRYKKPKNNEFETKDEKKNIVTLLEEQGKIQIQPMSYIRGGTFNNTIIIVDESQNMTPHEAKTIITRAGNNTIVIFCGDIEQIDSHYLSERSNGFSYTRYKMGDKEITVFVHLIKGERSYLASVAAESM